MSVQHVAEVEARTTNSDFNSRLSFGDIDLFSRIALNNILAASLPIIFAGRVTVVRGGWSKVAISRLEKATIWMSVRIAKPRFRQAS